MRDLFKLLKNKKVAIPNKIELVLVTMLSWITILVVIYFILL